MSLTKIVCGDNFTTNLIKDNINELIDENVLVRGDVDDLKENTTLYNGIKALPQIEGTVLNVKGFYADTSVGGGQFYYDSLKDKTEHNGGTVIAPEALVAWDGSQGDLATLLDWTGSGSGCFVRVVESNVLRLEWFGASETSAIEQFKICSSINNSVIQCQYSINNAGSTTASGVGMQFEGLTFGGSGKITFKPDCTVYNCEFNAVNASLSYNSERVAFLMCKFKGGAYISCEAGFNRGPSEINVSLCETEDSSLIYGTTLNNSKITLNKVRSGVKAFSISLAGYGNEISYNNIDGGVTGITIIPLRSANSRANLSNNHIHHNTVYNQSEESISLDCRGNSSTDGLVISSSTVTSATASTIGIDVTLPAFVGIGAYVIFHEGVRAGEFYEITYRGGDGNGDLQLKGYTAKADDIGLEISVSLGCFNNIIENNTIKDSTLTGIAVWGGYVGTKIYRNVITNTNINVTSLAGITSLYSNSHQPTHKTIIDRNSVNNGHIKLEQKVYGGAAIIKPAACELSGNMASTIENTVLANLKSQLNNNGYISGSETSYSSSGLSHYVNNIVSTTNGVDLDIIDIKLPSDFYLKIEVSVHSKIPQASGEVKATVLAFRSNEPTSRFGTSVLQSPLNKLVFNSGNRDFSAIEVTAILTTSTTINDTATLQLKLKNTVTGALVTGATIVNSSIRLSYSSIES